MSVVAALYSLRNEEHKAFLHHVNDRVSCENSRPAPVYCKIFCHSSKRNDGCQGLEYPGIRIGVGH